MSKIERVIELCQIKEELNLSIHCYSKDARDDSKLICDLRRIEARVENLINSIKINDEGE